VTAATIVAAVVGTLAAQRVRVTVVSSAYAVGAVVAFLVALVSSLLAILRSPELEVAEIAYAAMWVGAAIVLAAGNARWSNWDRFERRVAYGPVADVPVDRRPVLATSTGFLVLAATLALLILTGPSVWIVYLAVASLGLIALGASLATRDWRGAANPVAAPEPVDSARGSV
jgi:hypothetical protein